MKGKNTKIIFSIMVFIVVAVTGWYFITIGDQSETESIWVEAYPADDIPDEAEIVLASNENISDVEPIQKVLEKSYAELGVADVPLEDGEEKQVKSALDTVRSQDRKVYIRFNREVFVVQTTELLSTTEG